MKVLTDWLTQRAENAPISQHCSLPAMPALRIRIAWQKLKASACEADEVWAFANPQHMWKKRGKRVGYALLREETIVRSVVVTSERG